VEFILQVQALKKRAESAQIKMVVILVNVWTFRDLRVIGKTPDQAFLLKQSPVLSLEGFLTKKFLARNHRQLAVDLDIIK